MFLYLFLLPWPLERAASQVAINATLETLPPSGRVARPSFAWARPLTFFVGIITFTNQN